jgi:hypothetical protein
LTGVVVGIGVLALVAVPATVTALFALASFRYSEPPEPSVGVLWAGISLLLLTLPVAAGLLRVRKQSPPRSTAPSHRWLATGLAAVVLIGGWRLLQTVV